MNREFFALYDLVLTSGITQQEVIAFLIESGKEPPARLLHFQDILDIYSHVELVAQALATPYKDYARVGRRKKPGGIISLYASETFHEFMENRTRLLRALVSDSAVLNLSIFPSGSWAIQFTFTLRKPYISRDCLLYTSPSPRD